MNKHGVQDIISDLQAAVYPPKQLELLKTLKNNLGGHHLRKHLAVSAGLIPVLSALLSPRALRSRSGSSSKETEQELHGKVSSAIILNTTAIVAILANGGPNFVRDILDSTIVDSLVETLCSTKSLQIGFVILKSLNLVADNLPTCGPSWWREDTRLADQLYQAPFISWAGQILSHPPVSFPLERVCSNVLQLISKTCHSDKNRRNLSTDNVLTALSTRLASFIVADGYAWGPSDGGQLPASASPAANLSHTLRLVALLSENCPSRANQILFSPEIAAVLPKWPANSPGIESTRVLWRGQPAGSWQARTTTPIEALLPRVPPSPASVTAEHANFPPLGTIGPLLKRRSSQPPAKLAKPGSLFSREPDQDESPIIAWLVQVARVKAEECRLAATRYLVALFRLGMVKKSRVRMFAMVLVPFLVRCLEDGQNQRTEKHNEVSGNLQAYESLIEIPEILAVLIMDDESLQKSAVDAGAIKLLTRIFRATFDNTQQTTTPTTTMIWNPRKTNSLGEDQISSVSRTKLMGYGPELMMRKNTAYREGLLKALAAIAPFNDEYRKAICEQGILPCLIDSLIPMSFGVAEPTIARTVYTGNPAATLLAACSVAQALTRSVSALRTNLIDAGIASPIVKLLQNPDPEVKIAATRVVGNLVMDFSPMRETVSQKTVVRSLCEQAHSANPRLRFESIWALKQLVFNSPNPLKINVIQELGPSWIKQLIATDPCDIPPGVVIGLIDMDFPPRPQFAQDRLDSTEDVTMGGTGANSGTRSFDMAQDDGESGQTITNETNHHTVEDDTAIQEQLLDLIRNLFCGEKAADIVDYIFAEMDQKEFFDILLSRLRYRTIHGTTRKENQSVAPPTGIVIKVLYIIIHIAASRPRFRNLISSNTIFLRNVLTHTTHSSAEVKAQISWIAINLTYLDNKTEEAACRQRVMDLKKADYLTKLLPLLDDSDMDVRERAKTAVHLLRSY